MKSKEIDNKIIHLQSRIFNIKLNVNSGQYLSNYEANNMIAERVNLKKELSHLKRVQKLRKERKEKLNKIFNEN